MPEHCKCNLFLFYRTTLISYDIFLFSITFFLFLNQLSTIHFTIHIKPKGAKELSTRTLLQYIYIHIYTHVHTHTLQTLLNFRNGINLARLNFIWNTNLQDVSSKLQFDFLLTISRCWLTDRALCDIPCCQLPMQPIPRRQLGTDVVWTTLGEGHKPLPVPPHLLD